MPTLIAWGGGIAICIDAFEYLKNCNKKYHVIYSKAVLEHIPKENTFELLALINDHLEDDGIVMIDVPNMDWIWAAHERYMDFTHETGYTKESLGQVMRSFFTEVNIDYVDNSERFHGIKSFFARKIFGLLLYWSEPVIEPQNFFSRCILGVGKKKKQ